MNREKDVMVLLESCGEDRETVNAGLLTEGRRIAAGLGGSLNALMIGGVSAAPIGVGGEGVLYHIKGKPLSEYQISVFSRAAREFLHRSPPRLLLLAESDRGRELAPHIAAYLNGVAILGCVKIEIRGKKICYTKPCYGGQFERELSYPPGALEIVALSPEALIQEELVEWSPARIEEQTIDVSPETVRMEQLGVIPPDFRTVDISCAQRILGVGAGGSQKDVLPVLEELAELLESALGATRPVVDDGYLPREKMIGQTGKTVTPDLYLSLGISGSPHHVAGIQGAKRVIAVNKDQRAPIFQFSDLGFIADLKVILPKLNRRIREWRRTQS